MPDFSLEPFATTESTPELATSAAGDVSGRSNFRTSVINLERPGDSSVFGDQTRLEAAELISRYPVGQGRSALLPLLHLVQSVQGHVTPDGIAFCAETLNLTKAQVAAVATFYTMYKRSPTGEYLVSVCTNTLCGMLGGDDIFAALKEHLGVGHNQTTPDGSITLEHAECLAACDYAPVVTVNYEFFDNQTIGSARNIVSQLQSGERPLPTRGAPLCTFKQIERQIAGFHDDLAGVDPFAPDAVSSGVGTEVGVKLAIERGDTAPSYAVGSNDSGSASSADAESRGSAGGPSQNDAPLQTSGSDSANPAKPAGKEAK
ncbi:NADH-quinone oxidoreductase subunit NuoE [uncultured Jatrophihabitans sp.]|uniref:NADH-quinone oxidoreductase subunit NuoE n=1 Tax=uncultured Jatrophihabitans sp. TaxID=1610747 RepID=UPI0035CC77F2